MCMLDFFQEISRGACINLCNLLCKGAWLQTRTPRRSNEGRNAICLVERAYDRRLVRIVGGNAGLVRGSVSSQRQIGGDHERPQWYRNTKRNRHKQSTSSFEIKTGHSRNGIADVALGTENLEDDVGFRRHESRVDREFVAACFRASPISYYFHGVLGRREDARSSHEEGLEGAVENGG
jgi:hypothetical protein